MKQNCGWCCEVRQYAYTTFLTVLFILLLIHTVVWAITGYTPIQVTADSPTPRVLTLFFLHGLGFVWSLTHLIPLVNRCNIH